VEEEKAAPGLEDRKAGSSQAQLLTAQVIAHPDHGRGNKIAAILIGKAIDKVYIKLGSHEDVLGEEQLDAGAQVLLEMTGGSNR